MISRSLVAQRYEAREGNLTPRASAPAAKELVKYLRLLEAEPKLSEAGRQYLAKCLELTRQL